MIRTLLGPVKTALLLVCLFATLAAVMSVIVTPAARAETCPNEALRSGPSANLPDCRAYEQVSPVQKNGAYIETGSTSISPEGESVGFVSTSGFAGATSDLYSETGYQATRGSMGWVTTAKTQSEARYVQHHGVLSSDYLDETFGDALESSPRTLEGGVRLYLLQEFGQPEAANYFYRTGSGGVNEEVGPAYPPTAANLRSTTGVQESEDIKVLGWSADASHVVFTNPEPRGPNQWPFAEAGSLLEYAGTGNSTPLLVGINDEGGFVNNCPSQLLGGTTEFNHITNPISSDGSKVFFTDECKSELFARIDNGQPDAHTVAISQPTTGAGGECAACVTDPAEPRSARFFGASEDGSKVFFYTAEPLLDGTEGLYEYDFDAPEGERVTLIAPGFFGASSVLQTAQDGSHIYFFSTQVLTQQPSPTVQGKNAQGQPVATGAVAQEGENNVYVFERDARFPTGHIAFVATLGESERYSGRLETDTTPDGGFLILDVSVQLTSEDLGSASQIFEYDASTETMKRVSIGEDGFNDNGLALSSYPSAAHNEGAGFEDSNNARLNAASASVGQAFSPSAYADHLAVSADGSYVFFTSPIALTPHALNRVFLDIQNESEPYAVFPANVYEYHDGNVYLISDGSDISTHDKFSQVHLLSTDLSGRDVFFETTSPLVPQDTDTNKDIYDARIDGGFPAPAAPVECAGDACQGALSGAPVLLSPGSEHQASGDNLTPAVTAPSGVKPKALTSAQKLAAALKACKRDGTKKKRSACERAARSKYAPAKKAGKANHRGKGGK